MGQGLDPLEGNVVRTLSFLEYMYASGKANSTINVYRSMLSKTLPPVDNFELGKHSMVIRLMRAIYNKNPPRAKLEHLWDVSVVLNYAKAIDLQELSLLYLSSIVATLMAINLMVRLGELASITRESIVFSPIEAVFNLSLPRKTQYEGPLQTLMLRRQPEGDCPVYWLQTYLARADPLRHQVKGSRLFIG